MVTTKEQNQKYKQLFEIYRQAYSKITHDVRMNEYLTRELDGELTINEFMTDYILHLENEVERLKNILTVHEISYK